MGKGRGRGGSQFSSKGGGISATTRKEKRQPDDYDRDRSRSPVTKRPVLERLGPQVHNYINMIYAHFKSQFSILQLSI